MISNEEIKYEIQQEVDRTKEKIKEINEKKLSVADSFNASFDIYELGRQQGRLDALNGVLNIFRFS